MSDYPIAAPGWAAIDTVCSAIHRNTLPHQFTSATAYDLDSANPLPAICAWEAQTPVGPQWHYVTYGLSELFEKNSPVPHISGFGFELCLRLPRERVAEGVEQRPPTWPLRMLQGIGGYVMSGHGELDTGHIIDIGGPITGGDPATALEGVVCVPDPQLAANGKLEGPFGSVLFLLLVGLCRDEIDSMQAESWDLVRKVGLCSELAPGGATDPARGSWRTDPRRAAAFRRYELGVLLS